MFFSGDRAFGRGSEGEGEGSAATPEINKLIYFFGYKWEDLLSMFSQERLVHHMTENSSHILLVVGQIDQFTSLFRNLVNDEYVLHKVDQLVPVRESIAMKYKQRQHQIRNDDKERLRLERLNFLKLLMYSDG